ncbi:hypothetical protein DDQ41_29335 [Streptomyces spongiicola]|uniref:Uncharacterized protein n=1 Tax=Streptomyces spongiicola TaxID=1690221 RepID=A0ABM6VE09_9ACTN|nr:hypothetical protein DDQ41_29335 [Streptomyces spongiicola]
MYVRTPVTPVPPGHRTGHRAPGTGHRAPVADTAEATAGAVAENREAAGRPGGRVARRGFPLRR